MSGMLIAPAVADTYARAIELARIGHSIKAIGLLRDIISTSPDHNKAKNSLGVLLNETGDTSAAIALFEEILTTSPTGDSSVELNYGNALVAAGRADEAIRVLARVVTKEPNAADAWYAHGRALQYAGRAADAAESYRRSVELDPTQAAAWSSLSAATFFAGDTEAAEHAARRAITLDPTYDGGHFNLAIALLAQRRWEEGWREYEWRWQSPLLQHQIRPSTAPRWNGARLAGTLLVWAEQGLGDTLQGVRWLAAARTRVDRLVLACAPALVRHLRAADVADAVLPIDDSMPAHAAQLPLWSLPATLPLTTDDAVYVSAAPRSASRPSARGPRVRVGLAWAGSPTHINDRHRSMPASALAPLLASRGVTWVSLQRDADEPLGALVRRSGADTVDVDESIASARDFADTAALIATCDVVIAVDSAVAHCAARAGVPTWLLLPRVGLDWRWDPQATTTRWYDAVRCFRVPPNGTWSDVLDEVRAALAALMPDATSGEEYARRGEWAAAYAAWTAAQQHAPTHYPLLVNRASAARALRQFDLAESLARESVRVEPTRADGWMQLAHALVMRGAESDAVSAAREAVTRDPHGFESRATLARALERADRLPDAIACYDALIRERPDDPRLRYNRGLARLKAGRWREGWLDYEWRWSIPPYVDWRRRWPSMPVWDGSPLAGRHLLLRHEQGLGDTLMAVRWVPDLLRQGARVTLQVPTALQRLLRAQFPGIAVAALEDAVTADLIVPMLSLPQRLQATAPSTPAAPYLTATDQLPSRLAALLRDRPRPWIGVVWAGEPSHPFDHLRSRPLSFFDALREATPGTWVSLQVGERRHDLVADAGPGAPLIDAGAVLEDLSDTAQLLASLDHLVTIDSAPAHLAGALGVPTSVVLPRCADWRWGSTGDVTTWYESVRLIRPAAGAP